MDLNVKRLTADAGIFLSRAVQFSGELLGQSEKTELDPHLQTLLARADYTKLWTERIMKQTEFLLQPNPNVRLEEFLYEKLEKKAPMRANNHEQLGSYMVDSGHEFGPGTAYGNALIKCGETERQIGSAEREFIQSSANNFITPFRNFIEGDFQTISRERRLLQNKRLDLDVAKSKLKKAREAEARSVQLNSTPPPGDEYGSHFNYMLGFLHVKWLKMWSDEEAQAETELMVAQSDFDQQAKVTRLVLEGVSNTHAHHHLCLNEFVEAQAAYYARCCQYMVDLQKKLGSFTSVLSSNNNQPSLPSKAFVSIASPAPVSPTCPSALLNELPSSNTSCQARALNVNEAPGSEEQSLAPNEIITISNAPGDGLIG